MKGDESVKNITRLWKIITVTVILSVLIPAQKKDWKIVIKSGDTLFNYRLFQMSDPLVLKWIDKTISVPIDSVELLFRYRESHYDIGAGIGIIAGFIFGAMLGESIFHDSPRATSHAPVPTGEQILYTIGGGVLGSVLGYYTGGQIASGVNEKIYLTTSTHEQKYAIIKKMLLETNQFK